MGFWRWIYVVTAVTALYFNCFVLIVQSFMKVPALHDLAPTQSEPPFGIAQVACLALFIAIGIAAMVGARRSLGSRLVNLAQSSLRQIALNRR